MIIKSLKLSNYRRFASLDLEFPENIIGIIGRNGSGKSTIIEALGWALYGNKIVRTDKQDVRSQDADAKQACSAELLFSFGGSEYRIVRSLKGKNAVSEAAVYRDGLSEPEAVQDRGVNEFIENLLQLDYRSFTTSVFAQQKELAKLSSLQPEQRRQSINRLINIDRIDKAREQCRRERNEKQAFVSGKESALRDTAELEADIKSLKADETQKQKNVGYQQSVLKKVEEELKEVKQKFNAISKVRDEHMKLDAQIGKKQSRLEENEKNCQRAEGERDDIEKAEIELVLLQKQLNDFETVACEKEELDENREKSVKLTSRKSELDLVQSAIERETEKLKAAQSDAADLGDLEKIVTDLTEKEQSLENKRADLEEKIKQAHALKTTAESRGKEFKAKLDKIESLGPDGECPVCTQRLADHFDDVVADHKRQLSDLRQDYVQYRQVETDLVDDKKVNDAALAAARREKDAASKKLHSAQQAEKLVEQITTHISDYKNQESLVLAAIEQIGYFEYDENRHDEIKNKHKELLALQQKAATLKERVNRRESVESQLTSLRQNLSELEAELTSLSVEQKELGFSEQNFESIKSLVDEKTAAATMAKDELAVASQSLAVIRRDIENVEKEIQEQKKAREEIEKTKEEILYLNALGEHFTLFRLELAGRVRPLIAHRASELLALTTLSRYSQIDLDQDYNISIYDGAAAFPIERFSGGEQDLANLCLRIAISQVVAERDGGSPINFIVLDEIFGSQDQERRDLILNALAKLSSQFRQIFVITHIEVIKDMLPVLVHVDQKDDKNSKAALI